MNAIEVYAILKKKISSASSSILNKLANTDQNVQALSSDLEALDNNFNKKNTSKKPKVSHTPKTNNRFNSFSQRNYTSEELDELERRLLSK